MPTAPARARVQTPAHINGTVHSVVVPMPFADPTEAARAHAERTLRERQREAIYLANAQRHADAIRAAGEAGRQQGFKAGYIEGWHWGLTGGVVTGLIFGAGAAMLAQWLVA